MPLAARPARSSAGTNPRSRKFQYDTGRFPVLENTKASPGASSGFTVTSTSTRPGAIGTSRTPAAVFVSSSSPFRLHECRTWIIPSSRSTSRDNAQMAELWRTVREAHKAGESYSAIGRLLGISRQRVAQIVERNDQKRGMEG